MTMTTDMNGGPGVVRRLMKKVAIWEEALNYSGVDYPLGRIAFVQRIEGHYQALW